MAAVDLLADRLQPHFNLMLQRFELHLGDRIRDENDSERLADWMDSREALVRNADRFFPAFIAALRQGCLDAFDHSPAVEPTAPRRDLSQPLSLLEDDVVDEDGALAGLGARQEARASHPLMLLGHRFAVLLERPPLTAAELPVGPHAFGRAIQHAAKEAGVGLHSRLALYHFFEEDNATRFAATMEEVDSLLDRKGILPGLSYVPLRPVAVADHPQRGAGHAPEPGLVAEIVAMRAVNETIDRLIPDGTLPDHRLAERREAVAAMVRLVCRYGPESDAWRRCREVMAEVVSAAAARRPANPGAAEWIRSALEDLGYSEVDRRRLSEALVHLGQDIAQARAGGNDEHTTARARPLLPGNATAPPGTRRNGNAR